MNDKSATCFHEWLRAIAWHMIWQVGLPNQKPGHTQTNALVSMYCACMKHDFQISRRSIIMKFSAFPRSIKAMPEAGRKYIVPHYQRQYS